MGHVLQGKASTKLPPLAIKRNMLNSVESGTIKADIHDFGQIDGDSKRIFLNSQRSQLEAAPVNDNLDALESVSTVRNGKKK